MTDFIRKVFKRYNQNHISEAERKIVDDWYAEQVNNPVPAPNEIKIQKQIWKNISTQIKAETKVKLLYKWNWAAAIVATVAITVSIYIATTTPETQVSIASIGPASYKAILSKNSDPTEIIVTNTEQLKQTQYTNSIEILHVTAPKGASFDFTLPDGTLVYLNSDSKISYPNSFTGSKREINLEGEAYFEVTHQNKPFIVHTLDGSIKVLGTKFNVRAYRHRPGHVVSLLEGSVELSNNISHTLLKPGEMANLEKNQTHINIQTIGDSDPIAWKNGYFNFNNRPISELSEELSRWYNIEFDLSQLKNDIKLNGRISRQESLQSVLEKLSSTDEINFDIKNKYIIIKNN